ncbi:MAG: GC-type dockerin domain-anchored protein [Phycisphaerales bacterium JB039]
MRSAGRGLAGAAVAMAAGGAPCSADDGAILQWFEQPWRFMERRAPDLFVAGYDAVWLPPITRGDAPGTVGYDTFDRFDLGRPGRPTTYGTEAELRAAIGELHAAGARVFIDIVMNHNAGRRTDASFQAAGGYPGFWMDSTTPPTAKQPTSPWGDFHAGVPGGYLQSEDPGAPRYDLLRGDLVALIDIAQESNNQFIRHPVLDGEPRNIPAGSLYNRPDPTNARFYPDRDLAGFTFFNPGTPRNPGARQFTIHPFNTVDPLRGDPVTDNTTGLLMRWTQWTLDDLGVDGFRLDAAKHAPSWFWDSYWDSATYLRWRAPSGRQRTPYSFVESVEGNRFTYDNYVRRDGFADRDALDLNGAGQLRSLIGASGFGSWGDVLGAHIDTIDDGFNNGTVGVNHVFSHDNGSAGDGGAPPPAPSRRQQGLAQHAYVLLRTGPAIVYHNARGVARPGGFWPREGTPIALGLDPQTGAPDPDLVTLVDLRRRYGRGEFYPLNGTDPVNPSLEDVLVFERAAPGGPATVLVAANDRQDAGYEVRSVRTSFAPGTRLHELTAAAHDSLVDPARRIAPVLVVGADQRVLLTVPNNVSSAGRHDRGYVVYGPVAPAGEVELSGVVGVIPADPASAPAYLRRLAEVPVISADDFEVRLTTTAGDPLDPNTDDLAILRLGDGYDDLNGNGAVDFDESAGAAAGFERFLTVSEPLFGSGAAEGRYVQILDGAALEEGYQYLTVRAFRRRAAGEPIFQEWRVPLYLDRVGPAVELAALPAVIEGDDVVCEIRALDRTASETHALLDVPAGVDPISLVTPATLATRVDRGQWRRTFSDVSHGTHEVTIVALEVTGTASVTRSGPVFVDRCRADFDRSGALDLFDFLAFQNAFAGSDLRADFTGDGVLDLFDFLAFQNEFAAGCP